MAYNNTRNTLVWF